MLPKASHFRRWNDETAWSEITKLAYAVANTHIVVVAKETRTLFATVERELIRMLRGDLTDANL